MVLNIPDSEWNYKEWIKHVIENKKDVLGSKNDNMLKIYYFHSNQAAKQELEKNAKKQGQFHIVSMNYNESATKNNKNTEYWMHELEPGLLMFFTSSTKEGYEKTLQQKIRKIFGLHEMWIKPDTFKRIRKDLINNKECGITKFIGYRRKYDTNPHQAKEEAERRVHYFTDNPIDGILRLDEMEYHLGIMPKTIEYMLHSDKVEITNEGLFVLKTITQESFNLVDYVLEKIRMEEKDMREVAQGLKIEQQNIKKNTYLVLESGRIELTEDFDENSAREIIKIFRDFAFIEPKIGVGPVLFYSDVVDKNKGSVFAINGYQKDLILIPKFEVTFETFISFYREIVERIDEKAILTKLSDIL